jgi:glutathione S-transferase
MYQLYGFLYSQHTRRVISLLEEADIHYVFKPVNMMEKEHLTESYLAINPNHQVPTLIDGDICIHESNAILRYLCIKHKLWNWYPKNEALLAKVEQWLDWNQCQLSPLVMTIVMNRFVLGDKGDKILADEAELKMQEVCLILDNHLANHLFISGEDPSIADLSLASNIFQLGLANATPQLPNIFRWYASVSELKGFKLSLPKN